LSGPTTPHFPNMAELWIPNLNSILEFHIDPDPILRFQNSFSGHCLGQQITGFLHRHDDSICWLKSWVTVNRSYHLQNHI
jgi:hypothetical protein